MANISNHSTDESTDAIKPEAKDAPEVPAEVVPQVPPWKRTRNLSTHERNALYHELLGWRKEGNSPVLKRGALLAASKKFNLSRSTVDRFWKRAKEAMVDVGPAGVDVSAQIVNTYKLPHINKARLERLGELPDSIKVTNALRDKINKSI